MSVHAIHMLDIIPIGRGVVILTGNSSTGDLNLLFFLCGLRTVRRLHTEFLSLCLSSALQSFVNMRPTATAGAMSTGWNTTCQARWIEIDPPPPNHFFWFARYKRSNLNTNVPFFG
jgi:hypothetical protein